MKEEELSELSMDFSVRVVNVLKDKMGLVPVSNQLVRAATSVGANVYESAYSYGGADRFALLQIALKECCETEYWLALIRRTNLLDSGTVDPLIEQCKVLRGLLNDVLENLRTGFMS